jgi:hypothetical protein
VVVELVFGETLDLLEDLVVLVAVEKVETLMLEEIMEQLTLVVPVVVEVTDNQVVEMVVQV